MKIEYQKMKQRSIIMIHINFSSWSAPSWCCIWVPAGELPQQLKFKIFHSSWLLLSYSCRPTLHFWTQTPLPLISESSTSGSLSWYYLAMYLRFWAWFCWLWQRLQDCPSLQRSPFWETKSFPMFWRYPFQCRWQGSSIEGGWASRRRRRECNSNKAWSQDRINSILHSRGKLSFCREDLNLFRQQGEGGC